MGELLQRIPVGRFLESSAYDSRDLSSDDATMVSNPSLSLRIVSDADRSTGLE